MFGYIRASKPEMRIKEFEMYKTVYCSLCKELGKTYGIAARFTLSYDFTFLALLYMALNENCCGIKKGVCTCNPLKKCKYLENADDLKLPAAACMILLYYKILDNISDEKGFKRLGYKLVRPIFSSAYKKASKQYPIIDDIVCRYIDGQRLVEQNNTDSIDPAAEPTAICMAELFQQLSDDLLTKRCLNRLGYCIGRYIYILDAAVDLEEDIKLDRYNPLKGLADNENRNKDFIAPQLNICISEAAKAYELIDIKKFKNILDNLIYLGLQETFTKELKI
ncbi:MAG: DUF5685 family protein [Acutalibacteraceae bacterium]|nr:DUF5685 family protein [Acutalibacteraceae bacterium]